MPCHSFKNLSLCAATVLLLNSPWLSAQSSAGNFKAAATISPNYSELYAFGTVLNDGGESRGDLAQASDGNFYGTLQGYGEYGYGAVFSITPAGSYALLYSFQGGADGASPFAGLVQARDGYLYGTTTAGSSSVGGTIFRIWPGATSIETVYTFQDGGNTVGALVPDRYGNLYGMASAGGEYGQGSVFRYNLVSGYQLLHSFESGSGTDPYGSPLVASDGSLYGTTRSLSTGNLGTAWKMNKNGSHFLTFFDFSNSPFPNTDPQGGLTEASDGNVYGLSQGGGRFGYGDLFRITPGAAPTVTDAADLGQATAQEPGLGTMSADSAGNLYFSGEGGPYEYYGTISQYNIASNTQTILLSFPYDAGNTPLAQPLLAGDGNLYGTTVTGPASMDAFGSIYKYALADTPPVTLTASKASITLGQSVRLHFNATNAFSDSMKSCFITDNTPSHAPLPVGISGSRKLTPTSAGTITYGYTCGGVESATVTVTVVQ